MPIRTVLADDHQLVLEGLQALLNKISDIEVVGVANDGLEAVRVVRDLQPDVVIMDLSMPGLNGIDAIRRIRADCPEVRVLCLSMHSERQFVAAAFEVGASGYLVKDEPFDEMVGGIRAVMEGRKYLSSGVIGTVVDDYVARLSEGEVPVETTLTTREREVVQLVAEGFTTKEIAGRLNLSTNTIATYREHIKKKLGIDTTAGLTKYAVRHGLTSLDRGVRS